MLTTIGPWKGPAGRHGIEVTYIETLRPSSMWRTGRPACRIAASKVNEHPRRQATRSGRQYRVISVTSASTSPRRYTRYRGTSVLRSAPGAA